MNDFKFNQLSKALGPRIVQRGHSYLYFGGTAYLGIPHHPSFLAHYIEGLKIYGLNNGTSRNNNVQLGIYEEAEVVIAERVHAEAALITSSGYLAAQLAVQYYAHWGQVLYAPGSHPALWLNGSPQITGSFGYWSRHVTELINNSPEKRWVLISNSLNNLMPERYDFSFLQDLHPEKEIVLLADDSHGLGILNEGRGCYPDLPKLPNVKVLVIASMAKGCGVDAGVILGDKKEIAVLKKTNTFLGASPPAAAGLYAFMKAGEIYQQELQRLQNHCAYFSANLGKYKSAFAAMDGFPVYLSEDANLAKVLMNHNVLISSFAYPDQHGPLLNRIVLSSWHSRDDLDILLNLIANSE